MAVGQCGLASARDHRGNDAPNRTRDSHALKPALRFTRRGGGRAVRPDFVFDFSACRTQGSSLDGVPAKNDGFTEMKPQGHQTYCTRTGKKALDCITVFAEDGAKPARYEMKITTEMSQMLIIESDSGGDWVVMKPETGRVISTTRLLDIGSFGMKVCHGVFFTGDEFKAMRAKRGSAKPRKK